jgi:hypothetical protein
MFFVVSAKLDGLQNVLQARPKKEAVMVQTECQKLAARFAAKAANGLVDVKFYVKSPAEAVHEQVCEEVNRLYQAIERGDVAALDFKDARSQ